MSASHGFERRGEARPPLVRLDARDPSAIDAAARHLADGGCLGFPTETVYGLGARADDDRAVAEVFRLKGRPRDHPLIVHVADLEAARHFADPLPARAVRLIEAFWPAPLTLVVPRRAGMAEVAAGGQPSVGLRCPSHPVAQALLRAAARLGVPGLAAPSANRFGRLSPTTADHVIAAFGDEVPVLDGGACPVGIESTIVDCSREQAVWLRPGAIGRVAVEAVLGEAVADRDDAAPRVSGTLASHYAPRARVELLPRAELERRLVERRLIDPRVAPDRAAPAVAVYSRSLEVPPDVAPWRVMPDDAVAAARELFATLHELDAAGVDVIWVEAVPDDVAWEAVADRLRRASTGSSTH